LARWNLFFKSIALILAVTFAGAAQAIQVHALYTASCQREVGVVLDVSPNQLFLLTLKGEIRAINRYEVIYYATYPIDTVPIAEVKNLNEVPPIEIKTYQHGGLETLVRGWAVDFSQDKIAFLNLRGAEVMIDRTSIWSVEFNRQDGEVVHFTNPPKSTYNFVHPYAFASCEDSASRGLVKIYPQQLLSDPISIKREFDRLAEGHKQIVRYEEDQQFYPVPEVYSNETSLGLWLMSGSRYGSSTSRSNNFTPYLASQFSSGPFGFQSEFISGSAPILQGSTEETQTQIYYRMKADYFHFSAMVDPSLLLVGTKYQWRAHDLGGTDIRINDSALLDLGFDYGSFSLEIYPGGVVNMGAEYGDMFDHSQSVPLTRFGLRYQGYRWMLNLIGGSGSVDAFKAVVLRANLEWTISRDRRMVFSVIDRKLNYNNEQIVDLANRFQVEGDSTTAAAYGYFRFKKRYWAGGMLAAENVKVSAGHASTERTENKVYPKLGVMTSLSF
jgi:hypothetical protein